MQTETWKRNAQKVIGQFAAWLVKVCAVRLLPLSRNQFYQDVFLYNHFCQQSIALLKRVKWKTKTRRNKYQCLGNWYCTFSLNIMSRKLHQNCWFLAKREGWIIVTTRRIRKPLFKDRLCWKEYFYPSARDTCIKHIYTRGIHVKCTMKMILTICLGKICHHEAKTGRERKEILNNVSCRGVPSKCSPKDTKSSISIL